MFILLQWYLGNNGKPFYYVFLFQCYLGQPVYCVCLLFRFVLVPWVTRLLCFSAKFRLNPCVTGMVTSGLYNVNYRGVAGGGGVIHVRTSWSHEQVSGRRRTMFRCNAAETVNSRARAFFSL